MAARAAGFSRRAVLGGVAAVVVIALIAAGIVVATSGSGSTKHLTAYFTRTVGLYTGNDVRILGVKVGKIDSITPDGPQVKVVMSYDGDDKVPDNAKAVIVTPSIVSDRYVQLSPAYTSGPTLPDNAVLQTKDTRVPLELDEVFGNLNKLNVALGPRGANKHGALSRLIKIGAANLNGNGKRFNNAMREFSAAISTLAGGRTDLFGTVSHLQRFTTMLAQNDGGIRKLNANLATVGGELAGERKDLGAALANLATALSAVNGFVANNRKSLTQDVSGLSKVTNVLRKEKEAIAQFTDLAPLGLANLSLAYDPQAQTLDTKSDTSQPISQGGPSGAICQLLHTVGLDVLLNQVAGCQVTQPGKTAVPSHRHATSLSDLLKVGR